LFFISMVQLTHIYIFFLFLGILGMICEQMRLREGFMFLLEIPSATEGLETQIKSRKDIV